MKHTPKATQKRGRGMQTRPGDTISASGASFWGLNGG
jgi:hypothetical protein